MSAIMPVMDFEVRAARREDTDAAELLYASAAPYYDAYAGSSRRARKLLTHLWRRPGHTASFEVSRVAVRAGDGEIVGVLAGFPLRDSNGLATRFVSLSLRRLPPWRWPQVAAHLRAAGRLSPHPPPDSFYVDALAVRETARRQGVATSLLDDAARTAVARRASGVALDTGLANAGAKAFYEAIGFERTEVRTASDPRTVRAIGGRGFVSYFRAV
jgi:ribosomal protein S18 acetylase RimI-like enzyme